MQWPYKLCTDYIENDHKKCIDYICNKCPVIVNFLYNLHILPTVHNTAVYLKQILLTVGSHSVMTRL